MPILFQLRMICSNWLIEWQNLQIGTYSKSDKHLISPYVWRAHIWGPFIDQTIKDFKDEGVFSDVWVSIWGRYRNMSSYNAICIHFRSGYSCQTFQDCQDRTGVLTITWHESGFNHHVTNRDLSKKESLSFN